MDVYSNYKVVLFQIFYCKQNLQYQVYFAKHINCVTISASFSNLLILCKNTILIGLLDIKNAKKRECSDLHSLFYIWWRWRELNPRPPALRP